MIQSIHLPYPIPYCAQIASPELAEEIFTRGMDPALDTRWAESGAETAEEYAYWVRRACGVACLKMCVEALGGPVRPLAAWARAGAARGAYLIRRDGKGEEHEIGWVHSGLADMAREAGFQAQTRAAGLADILGFLRAGWLVIASVSYQLGDDHLPVTKQGGHLIVVTGVEYNEAGPLAFFANNPSGRRPGLQAGARLPVERFAAAYGGRVILVASAHANDF